MSPDELLTKDVMDGIERVDQGGSSWTDNEKTIKFDKPKQSKVSIKIKYWDKLQKKTVRFTL